MPPTFGQDRLRPLCLTRHLSAGSVKLAELWPSTPGAELAMGFRSVDKPEQKRLAVLAEPDPPVLESDTADDCRSQMRSLN